MKYIAISLFKKKLKIQKPDFFTGWDNLFKKKDFFYPAKRLWLNVCKEIILLQVGWTRWNSRQSSTQLSRTKRRLWPRSYPSKARWAMIKGGFPHFKEVGGGCATFWNKISLDQIIQKCIIQQKNGKTKIRWLMAVFGGFAAVSSQFLNKHHKSNCHTKAHCCNSFLCWVPALVLMVSKSGTSAFSLLMKLTKIHNVSYWQTHIYNKSYLYSR